MKPYLKIRLENLGDNQILYQVLEQKGIAIDEPYTCSSTGIMVDQVCSPALDRVNGKVTRVWLRVMAKDLKANIYKVSNAVCEVNRIKIALWNFINFLKKQTADKQADEYLQNIYTFE